MTFIYKGPERFGELQAFKHISLYSHLVRLTYTNLNYKVTYPL